MRTVIGLIVLMVVGVVTAGTWDHGREKSGLATDLEPDDASLDEYRDLFHRVI